MLAKWVFGFKFTFIIHCLNRLFLVKKALKCNLVQYLLQVLDSNLLVENPASVKAHIVDAIKAMLNSLQHLTDVEALLSDSKVWRQYKDQNHALFISNTPTAGYLTNSTASVAGNYHFR
jgi:DnaJ homolog subfamily C member 13